MAERFDIAIVGGGPAGQAAARFAASRGASVAVFDEQARPGGQILRQPPAAFRVPDWLPGRTYRPLKRDLARFERSAVQWFGSRSVLGIEAGADFSLLVSGPEGTEEIAAARLLIAGGCQDLAVPLPGWTLPGVMTVGGLQAFVKSQRIVPAGPVLLAGTHPLMLVAAQQIVAGGGEVAAVLFAQPRAGLLGSLARSPAAALAGLGNLGAGGQAYGHLRRAGTPVLFGQGLAALEGEGRLQAAVLASGRRISCATAGLGYGFVPQAELVRQVGAVTRPAGRAGGHAAAVGAWSETSVPGLFAAGETLGVAGAAAAGERGRIAGIGMALSLGLVDEGPARRAAAPARRRLRRLERFADLLDRLADPAPYWPPAAPETLACRCEDVSFAALRQAAAEGAGSADAVKLKTRCGMGLCQGRNCEPSVLRLLEAEGRRGDPGFAARFPARPVPIADLAAKPLPSAQ